MAGKSDRLSRALIVCSAFAVTVVTTLETRLAAWICSMRPFSCADRRRWPTRNGRRPGIALTEALGRS